MQKKNIILLIEDELPLIRIIKKNLEINNFKILIARTVKEAIEALQKNKHISAVWLDHYLIGKKNGMDLVYVMKKKKSEWKDIPIFVVSNTATGKKIYSYIELGVVKFYVKTDHFITEIIKDIKKYLSKEK